MTRNERIKMTRNEGIRMSRVARIAMTCALIGVTSVTVMLLGVVRSTDAAGPPSAALVREQNLDAQGLIRVHEQGIANVNVTNLPLDAGGNVRVGGAVDVTGSVEIAKTAPVEVRNTPTVVIRDAVPIKEPIANDTLFYAALDAIPSGEAEADWDGVVTAVSLWASSDAHFQLSGHAVFSIHVKAGTNVVQSFDAPLDSNHLLVTCPGGCNASVSIVGYVP